jgi:flavin-dependent dehydrogenase
MSHDVMILGAGVAGTAAAILLRRQGMKPVLIDRAARRGRRDHAPDWLSGSARGLLGELKIDCSECLGKPYTGIVFHSADLKRTAQSLADDPPAFRIDYPRLIERLQAVARDEAVEVMNEAEPSRIDLGERRVCAVFPEGKSVEASFLLLADGARRTFAAIGSGQVSMDAVNLSPTEAGRWVATLELPAVGGKAKAAADTRMHWLLGLDRHQACMVWWQEGANWVLSLLAGGTGHDVARLLCTTAGRLIEAGLIASREPIRPEAVAVRPAPARSALEIDSHVDKRSLLIGDAGGFISETSGEGIYAAVWSARLAVESVVAAAASRQPQDELRQFSMTWRSTMADYLRPPNTDVHFLLPLIFSNQQMADRMAAAFWIGTNI